jgi:hypothetical protein
VKGIITSGGDQSTTFTHVDGERVKRGEERLGGGGLVSSNNVISFFLEFFCIKYFVGFEFLGFFLSIVGFQVRGSN